MKSAEESLFHATKFVNTDYIWSFGDDDYIRINAFEGIVKIIEDNNNISINTEIDYKNVEEILSIPNVLFEDGLNISIFEKKISNPIYILFIIWDKA